MPEYYPSALACYRTRYWSYRILRRPDRARAAFIVDSALKVPYFFRWKTLSRYRRSWYRLYHAALTWRRSTLTLFRNHLSRYLERSARTATSCKESACIWSRGISLRENSYLAAGFTSIHTSLAKMITRVQKLPSGCFLLFIACAAKCKIS